MSARHWTEDLKPGDMVVVKGYDHRSEGTPAKVGRLTATQVVVELPRGYEARFRKKDGWGVGQSSSWRRNWLVEMTPILEHHFALISARRKVRKALEESTEGSYPLEVWRELLAILEREDAVEP